MNNNYILALDVGTTGIKAFVFDDALCVRGRAYESLPIIKKPGGIVEQDPFMILHKSEQVMRRVIQESNVSKEKIMAMGITNQRETTIVWDKHTGKPVHNAIVWKDSRTQTLCVRLEKQYGTYVKKKTGLPILPYFSASKIIWILQHNISTQKLSKKQLLCGTVDSWLLWHWLEHHDHVTDYTNASRTLLFNIKTRAWDKKLLSFFNIPYTMLPRTKPSQSLFGILKKELLGISIPIRGVCGDQEASLYAAGTKKSTTKVTYGTGAFLLICIGNKFRTHPAFFTTLTAGKKNAPYAFEKKVVEDCGVKVARVLGHYNELIKYLTQLTKKVSKNIQKIPFHPKEIVIDGGITQIPYLSDLQSELFQIPVRRQVLFDGTALGIAKLVKDSMKK